jgi:internalin A
MTNEELLQLIEQAARDGVTRLNLNGNDDLSQRTLIGFLHDLGIVLNFQDDPRLEETNILKPEWVTSGVYKILNNEVLLTEHQGVLERARLNRILDPDSYPRSKHLFIMDMMRKFELCFDFEGFTNHKFLIPDLLPKEEPDTGDWSNTLAFQYHYAVLPGSVISRFIVRMNHLIHQHTYWRNGVVLAYDDGVSNRPVRSTEINSALVKADREDRKIFIWVSGPEAGRRRFLAIIRAEFAAIHRTIPGLDVEEKVPLPGHPEIVVDYQYLRDLEEMGEAYFVPPGLRERVGVKKVLDGVESEQVRRTGQRDHNSKAIRELLIAAFSDEEFDTFCYDRYRPVYKQFSDQMSHSRKIQLLIEHCEKYEQLDDLMAHIEAANPRQYNLFIPE